MRAFPSIAALLVAGSVLGCAASRMASTSDGGDNPDLAPAIPGCTAHDKCAGGSTCVNGVCYSACTQDKDCAANQYCDSSMTGDYLCHSNAVTACPAMPCAGSQICVNGLCSTPPPGFPCGVSSPFDPYNDHCGKDAVCLTPAVVDGKVVTDPNCYTFELCPKDGVCPVSSGGSLCNDGIIMGKSRICLAGLCKTAANCPAKWSCVFSTDQTVLYGKCTTGEAGTACGKAADCVSSTCKAPYQGAFGICQ